MLSRRLLPLLPIFALTVFAQSCKDATDPVSPVEPQFARKVKRPPPEPVLKEFWVHQDVSATSTCSGEIIHIVVSGEYEYIGTTLTHDHFFNGVRDRDFHFEYGGFRGPKDPTTDWNADGTEGHIDVCFLGEQLDYIYGDGSGGLRYFVDYPSTSVGGTGADPFTVSFGAVIDSNVSHFETKGFRPTGVVLDGKTGSPEVASAESAWHGETFTDVRSYAVWESDPPAGYLFFDGITVSNASCQVSTARVGKGKNKTEVTTTTVTAEVDFDFGAEDLGELIWDQAYWTEGHLRVTSITGSPLFTSPYQVQTRQQDGVATYTWSIDENLAGEDVGVEFLADFLIAQSAATPWAGENVFDYVYDPGQNGVPTTTGFDGDDPWVAADDASRKIYDGLFPVAHSNSFPVTCEGG